MDRLLKLADRLKDLEWFPQLVVRVSIGLMFFKTGQGKLSGLLKHGKGLKDHFCPIEFFTQLKIPMPALNAWVASALECFGGLLLVLGLGTRLVTPPLAFTMLVAIITAKRDEVKGLWELVGLHEWALMLIFGWLIFAGAGKVSLDHLVRKRAEGAK